MSVLRPFRATDLFKFNNMYAYGISFYLSYLARWPDLCCAQEAPSGRMMGYIIGKAEGPGTDWHGHVTALTVAPEYRRLSLARKMMDLLEHVSDQSYRGYFVDLYVRCTNQAAITMYERLGYSVYRRVGEYYGSLGLGRSAKDEEDAFGESTLLLLSLHMCPKENTGALIDTMAVFTDMRKPLSRDPYRRSVRPGGREIVVSAHDVS
ncbi:hypothetical protein PHLCEN_2v2175 [Hermanssonia centrifuga]|uniref:N-acetyltransferase domain-containing protein n=1 Tax=Hermanssonia centrifuga TaxID=98765 RepID=A0A2R6RPW5_9APHY|nr:hypothetical protein PHLCEN_2v2175 [Hermanssonia centrifuga]